MQGAAAFQKLFGIERLLLEELAWPAPFGAEDEKDERVVDASGFSGSFPSFVGGRARRNGSFSRVAKAARQHERNSAGQHGAKRAEADRATVWLITARAHR